MSNLNNLVTKIKEDLRAAAELADKEGQSFSIDMGGGGIEYIPLQEAYEDYINDHYYGEDDTPTLEDFKNLGPYNEWGEYVYGTDYGWNNTAWMPSSAFC